MVFLLAFVSLELLKQLLQLCCTYAYAMEVYISMEHHVLLIAEVVVKFLILTESIVFLLVLQVRSLIYKELLALCNHVQL